MKIIVSYWFNAIIFLILYLFLYFFLAHLKISRKSKKFLSVTSVILVFLLTVFSVYSSFSLYKKKQSFKVIKPVILEVKDISGFDADKYLVNIVIPPGLKKSEIKAVILDSSKYVKKRKKNASVIWFAVYNKALPSEELNATKNNPYFVTMGRWASDNYNGLFSQNDFKYSERYKGIEIFWKI